MRKVIPVLFAASLLAAGVARAEVSADAIPADVLGQLVPFAIQAIQAQFPEPPVKIEAQGEKAVGYHVQEKVGVMAIPDKNLTVKAVEEATDKDVPVALFSTLRLTISEKDQPVQGDRLALVTVGNALKLPIFFLAVQKKGEERVLNVYSKDGKPVSTVPLKKQAGDAAVPVALKLTNIDLENKKTDLTVSLSGAYEGTLKLAYLEP
jgi:hypothetical protein